MDTTSSSSVGSTTVVLYICTWIISVFLILGGGAILLFFYEVKSIQILKVFVTQVQSRTLNCFSHKRFCIFNKTHEYILIQTSLKNG